MSSWTYVTGLIEVDVPGRTQAEIDYILQTVLNHLPKVTGSEGDMDIHTVRASGHNSFKNFDEFYNWVPECIETQSRYFLVLDGNLRHREYENTFEELNVFLNRLAKRIRVLSLLVKLQGYKHSYIFTNKTDCYSNMYEFDDPWWGYLMWDFEDDK